MKYEIELCMENTRDNGDKIRRYTITNKEDGMYEAYVEVVETTGNIGNMTMTGWVGQDVPLADTSHATKTDIDYISEYYTFENYADAFVEEVARRFAIDSLVGGKITKIITGDKNSHLTKIVVKTRDGDKTLCLEASDPYEKVMWKIK